MWCGINKVKLKVNRKPFEEKKKKKKKERKLKWKRETRKSRDWMKKKKSTFILINWERFREKIIHKSETSSLAQRYKLFFFLTDTYSTVRTSDEQTKKFQFYVLGHSSTGSHIFFFRTNDSHSPPPPPSPVRTCFPQVPRTTTSC